MPLEISKGKLGAGAGTPGGGIGRGWTESSGLDVNH